MAVKLVASLLLLTVAVLASKDATNKPVDGAVAVASTPRSQPAPSVAPKAPATKKVSSHGKREVTSYGIPHQPHHRYSFGHGQSLPSAEFYAPPATSHGSYSYSIPQHSSFPPSFGGHKLYLGPTPSLTSFKYMPAGSSHAFFAPAFGHSSHPSFGGFGEPAHVKYGGSSFGSKDLSDLLKQLHSVGPLTIKAVPAGYAYGAYPEPDAGHGSSVVLDSSAFHLKPLALKFHQDLPSFSHGSSLPHAAALSAPAGPTSTSSSYGHVAHSAGYEHPSYASGVKGLRHYSTPNVPSSDLYSGNKYISTLNLHQPTTATMVSPLHTSVHSTVHGGGAAAAGHQKPFKPSTYLGATHETVSAPSSAHTGAYLAPALQYLPPVGKGSPFPPKLSYDSPAKHGYLPPAPPSTNAYLPPPKPAHGYLPPASSASSNYIPLSSGSAPSSSGSHEDAVRKPSPHHHLHGGEQHSSESLEYSGATAAVPTPSAVTSAHHWKH
uniref:Uncharacterized protein n=1 Tax=Anopheles epiroticus TaxID=199890 RepID=A0A182P642_9DIPT